MKILIVGLGLIGGSIAKELKTRSLGTIEVFGVDINPIHEKKAIELKLVDRMLKLEEGLRIAEVIILAMPVNIIQKELVSILDQLNEGQVLIDTGSTKNDITNIVKDHPNRNLFVAAHPLAGTEFSGPEAAILDLFKGKKNIICNKELSSKSSIDLAEKVFNFLGMQSYYLDSKEHDKHMAYVSHLSHISSFTLSLTVQEIEQDEKQIFNLASTGFASTARLAKSNAKTWGPIFDANAEYLIEAIDKYIDNLNAFKENLKSGNALETENMMIKANEISRVLDGIKLNN